MKFSKPGQILLATVVSALVGLGLTSCGQSNTIDYLYVTANKSTTGQISVYWVDQESGAIRQIPDSPYPSGGQNPVAEVATPNGRNLFVVNHDDNTLVQFTIGSDAKLYPETTCNTPGTEPEAVSVSPDGRLLFVADTYAPAPSGQAAYSETNPGPGALVVYPLTKNVASASNSQDPGERLSSCTPVANGSLNYWLLGDYPGAIALAPTQVYQPNVVPNETADSPNFAGLFPYVTNTGAIVTTTTPPTSGVPVVAPSSGAGTISGFSIGTGGVLSPLTNSPFAAGTAPTGIAATPTGQFLYAVDSAQNQVIEYTILSSGQINPLNPGVTATGTFPVGITVDPRSMFVYVTNYTDGTVSSYNINQANGSLSSNASPITKTGPGSTCVTIEPSLDRFLFTSNFLENEVSSAELNPNTGSLTTDQNSPYPSAAQPTCVAAVAHGNHSQENVTVAPSGNN